MHKCPKASRSCTARMDSVSFLDLPEPRLCSRAAHANFCMGPETSEHIILHVDSALEERSELKEEIMFYKKKGEKKKV